MLHKYVLNNDWIIITTKEDGGKYLLSMFCVPGIKKCIYMLSHLTLQTVLKSIRVPFSRWELRLRKAYTMPKGRDGAEAQSQAFAHHTSCLTLLRCCRMGTGWTKVYVFVFTRGLEENSWCAMAKITVVVCWAVVGGDPVDNEWVCHVIYFLLSFQSGRLSMPSLWKPQRMFFGLLGGKMLPFRAPTKLPPPTETGLSSGTSF